MRQIISIGTLLLVLSLVVFACASPDAPSEPATVSNRSQSEADIIERADAVELVENDEDMAEAEIDDVVKENGPSAQEIAQMERAAAGTIRDNERAGNRKVEEAEATQDEIRSLASFLPNLGEAPEIINGEPWINSDPLTLAELEGKVVVIEFWTYT